MDMEELLATRLLVQGNSGSGKSHGKGMYDQGIVTLALAEAMGVETDEGRRLKIHAALTKAGKLLSVAGGGDTVSALAHAGAIDDLSYVSTAGGAFLEWLEGRELPGVTALEMT